MAISRENEGKRTLIPLSKYLERIRPVVEQSADDVAGIFLSLKAAGKSVKIRERKRP
jgi:hypothetical protein